MLSSLLCIQIESCLSDTLLTTATRAKSRATQKPPPGRFLCERETGNFYYYFHILSVTFFNMNKAGLGEAEAGLFCNL